MAEYIIKNCPSLNQARNLCNEIINTCCADYNMGKEVVWCEDCTDCLLKRIVEKCKEQKEPQIRDYKTDIEYFRYSARHSLAKEILSMLEIEECEE